jgi:uncharacterized protein YdaU (DUF1376 family)
MHYYKRHIGDYARKAGRFTLLEHGACTLLVDACYDRERFPNDEEAFAWAWARTDEEKQAVRFVLLQLFVKVGDLWVNEQIQEDLEKYHANADKNREIAINRERQKRERARSVHEACTITEPSVNLTTNHKPLNQEPRTKNQEPETKNHKPKNKSALPQIVSKKFEPEKMELPECIRSGTWEEWIAYRRQRKLSCAEITLNAQLRNLEGWHNDGHNANEIISRSIANGWQGLFEPKNNQANASSTAQSGAEQLRQYKALQAKKAIKTIHSEGV